MQKRSWVESADSLDNRDGLPSQVWALLATAWDAVASAPAEDPLSAGHAALITECCAFARLVIQSGDDSVLLLLINGGEDALRLPLGGGYDDADGRYDSGGTSQAVAPALLTLLVRLAASSPPPEPEVLHPLWLSLYDVVACITSALRTGDCRVVNELCEAGLGLRLAEAFRNAVGQLRGAAAHTATHTYLLQVCACAMRRALRYSRRAQGRWLSQM